MGVYYQVACDEAKESIDPGSIEGFGNKGSAISCPEHVIGSLAIFATLTRWKGKSVRLADDRDEDPGFFEYKDVTECVLAEYNEANQTEYRFTG